MRPPRFRTSTLMLLVVIVALAAALVVQQARMGRERIRAEVARVQAEEALRAAAALRTTPAAPARPPATLSPAHAGGVAQ
jgi:hypothetical protein